METILSLSEGISFPSHIVLSYCHGKMFFFSIIIYLGVNQWIVSPLKDWLNVSNLGEWFVWALGSTSVYAVVLGIFLYIFDTGFSTFVKRFISIRRKV